MRHQAFQQTPFHVEYLLPNTSERAIIHDVTEPLGINFVGGKVTEFGELQLKDV